MNKVNQSIIAITILLTASLITVAAGTQMTNVLEIEDGIYDELIIQPDNLITSDSVGKIRLGSKLSDVRAILKGVEFSRSPGEGVDEIEVMLNGKTIMFFTAHHGDEDYRAPVKGSTEIIGITVLDARFKTKEGVGAGTPLKEAAKQYSALKHIWIEGLTGDEYASFWNQPAGIDFQVVKSLSENDPEDRAGIYVGDNTTTAVFEDDAVINAIKIPGSYGPDFLDNEINLVTPQSAGKIKIGMTLGAAQAAMENAEFVRSGDGEGVALVSVRIGDADVMTIFAGEEDPEKPFDNSARIEFIEVWSSEYRTKEGLTPGMLIRDAEKIYGPLKMVYKGEIESRETVDFERQPTGISFRSSDAGIYGEAQNKTNAFNSAAAVISIQLTRIPNTAPSEND